MGIFKLEKDSVCRRIDLKIYPKEQYPYAVLYFTGSAQFNKIMRKVANDHKFTMSDAGIKSMPSLKKSPDFDPQIEQNLKALAKGKNPNLTEEDIIRAFKFTQIKPQDREL